MTISSAMKSQRLLLSLAVDEAKLYTVDTNLIGIAYNAQNHSYSAQICAYNVEICAYTYFALIRDE